MAEKRSYDIVIIGGGPAGLTAGLYAARAKYKTLVLEREMLGGKIANVELIENYPGFPEGINGFELGQLMYQQALKYGVEVVLAEATGLKIRKNGKKVVSTTDGDFEAQAVIVAGAARRQKLEVPGEDEYTGRGVSYCATCDGPLFPDKVVAVAGGGDGALTEALHLAKFASKVIVIHRRDQLRAGPLLQERAKAEPKIEFLLDTIIEKIEGDRFVQRLALSNVKTGEKSTLEVGGIFVAIGFTSDTGFLKGTVPLNNIGQIITNEKMETEVPGIYAAGDIRASSIRQVIGAAGDGAAAAVAAQHYLTEK